LTEAGERFHAHCLAVLDGARTAFDSVADLRREPSGTVRVSCSQALAQNYLAPILVDYLAAHPKVRLELDASDRDVNLVEERFDLAIRCRARIEESSGLVARLINTARHLLVASRNYLDQQGRPDSPKSLFTHATICRPGDLYDDEYRWALVEQHGGEILAPLMPRLVSDDLRIHVEAAQRGMGIALLPEPVVASALKAGLLEQALPDWTGVVHRLVLLYPTPRGMLPSVRSLIDYLLARLSTSIEADSGLGQS